MFHTCDKEGVPAQRHNNKKKAHTAFAVASYVDAHSHMSNRRFYVSFIPLPSLLLSRLYFLINSKDEVKAHFLLSIISWLYLLWTKAERSP